MGKYADGKMGKYANVIMYFTTPAGLNMSNPGCNPGNL
jgi:hypothetical protein